MLELDFSMLKLSDTVTKGIPVSLSCKVGQESQWFDVFRDRKLVKI